jgi:hypothetical protein
MPSTAAGLGVRNSFDPDQNIDGTAHYLRQQLDAFGGDLDKALAAYNAGPAAVRRYGGVPPFPETQAYVQKVKAAAAVYGGDDALATPPSPVQSSSNPIERHGGGALRALLAVGLVGAGATLVYLGIARTAGIQQPIRKPARAIAAVTPLRAVAAVKPLRAAAAAGRKT